MKELKKMLSESGVGCSVVSDMVDRNIDKKQITMAINKAIEKRESDIRLFEELKLKLEELK